MLLYPVLEWYFGFVTSFFLPISIVVVIGSIIMGYFGFSEIRNVILIALGAPLIFYVICFGLKLFQPLPLIGDFGILVRYLIDILIVLGIAFLIRYFCVGKTFDEK